MPETMAMRLFPFVLIVVAAFTDACASRADSPYGACAASAACSEASPRCVSFRNRITMQNAPLCTVACMTSADCPDRGVCVPTETPTLGSLCMQRCTTATECRFNQAFCVVVREGESACVP
jgi:ABC-type Fe3+-hydroxamate transport system substrate-binding protein